MNFKFTAFILLLLVVLIGVAIYLANKPSPAPTSKFVFGVPPADIQKLTYQPANGPETILQKQGERWRILSPISAWMDDYKAQNLITSLTQLAYLTQIQAETSGANSLASNGLAPPQSVITLTDEAGRNYTLNVGQQDAQGRLYVATSESPGFMDVVDASWIDPLMQPPDNLRDMTLANFQPDLVKTIQIIDNGKTSLITHDGDSWTLTEPVRARIDASKIQDWLDTLQGMTAQSFVSNSAATASLKHSREKIELTFSAQVPEAPQPPLDIQFGGYTDLTEKNIYVNSSQNPGAAVVDAGQLSQLQVQPLRDSTLIHQNLNEATGISVHWNVMGNPNAGGNWFLTRDKNDNWEIGDSPKHYHNGPLADVVQGAVDSLLAKLSGLQADHFIDNPDQAIAYGLSPPHESIDIQMPGHDVKVDIGLPQKSGYTAFKTPDWPSLYLVKTDNATGLTPDDFQDLIKKPAATMTTTTKPATFPAGG
ncbi:MAG TPA: DUF4340 domain-containing protein [Phycisphaerae bacterium]|nr:DUF4340 domain-containing protein [Phycisphaerae bacterium]